MNDCVQMDETGRTSSGVMERLLRTRWRHWISRGLFILLILVRIVLRSVMLPSAMHGKLLIVDLRVRPLLSCALTLRHHFLTLRCTYVTQYVQHQYLSPCMTDSDTCTLQNHFLIGDPKLIKTFLLT